MRVVYLKIGKEAFLSALLLLVLILFPVSLRIVEERPCWTQMNKDEIFMPAGLITVACGILLAFHIFQGFHTLFYQEEESSLPTGLPETGWNLQSLGQNAGSCRSAVEWSTAGVSWGYHLLPRIKNRKS